MPCRSEQDLTILAKYVQGHDEELGFPKIRCIFLGVPIIRMLAFGGL